MYTSFVYPVANNGLSVCEVVHRMGNNCPKDYPCYYGVCVSEVIQTHHGSARRLHCLCDVGWVGNRCDVCCNRVCQHLTWCDVTEEGETFCRCPWDYEGHYCNTSTVTEATDIYDATKKETLHTTLAVVLLLMTCVSVALVTYVWKHRTTLWLKLVTNTSSFWKWNADEVTHPSTKSTPENRYDVFVSYRSTARDENFVHNTLVPWLEGTLNLSVCIHHRDFIPGKPVANNIISSIEGSRFTILVLTAAYVSSEWTRLEYQAAQLEMLQLRHRIVPLLLDKYQDMNITDINLKFILKTVTYSEYPGPSDSEAHVNRFWKSLAAALEKR